jgi:hypothetical protein
MTLLDISYVSKSHIESRWNCRSPSFPNVDFILLQKQNAHVPSYRKCWFTHWGASLSTISVYHTRPRCQFIEITFRDAEISSKSLLHHLN